MLSENIRRWRGRGIRGKDKCKTKKKTTRTGNVFPCSDQNVYCTLCTLHPYSRLLLPKLLSLKGSILQASPLCFSLYHGRCFCFSSPSATLVVVFFLLKWSLPPAGAPLTLLLWLRAVSPSGNARGFLFGPVHTLAKDPSHF